MAEPPILRQIDSTHVVHEGRELVYFGGSDYLRMSWHAEVRAAGRAGIALDGLSACASRLTTGNVPVYGELESALESYFGWGCATLTSSGYFAPMVLAQAVAQDFTHVMLDERAHACLRDAAQLTGLPTLSFAHREPRALAAGVRSCGRKSRCLVMTDGLFTHSGSVAPLREYLEVLPVSAQLVVDDAHGTAVLGVRGRGSVEHARVALERVWLTTTLSKGIGSYGGVILGPRRLRALLLERSRIITGNTAVPPPLAAGALASLKILSIEGKARRERLSARSTGVRAQLARAGMAIPAGPGPMFTYAPPTRAVSTRLRRALFAAGIYPTLIRYPNGPAPEFYRFALSSEHEESQVAALVTVLCDQVTGAKA